MLEGSLKTCLWQINKAALGNMTLKHPHKPCFQT